MITIGFSTRKVDNNFVELLRKTSGIPKCEIIPIENNGEFSLTELYNKILDQSSNDIVILCHDDIYFDTKNWGQKILNHFKRNSDYGILGLAGTTIMPKSGRWWDDPSKMKGIVNHEHGGKKWESKYSPSKGNELDDVVLVDGLFIVVNKKNIKEIFNERSVDSIFMMLISHLETLLRMLKLVLCMMLGLHINRLVKQIFSGKKIERYLLKNIKTYYPLKLNEI
jgi:hypothetical protein